jgi:hypothetical protein
LCISAYFSRCVFRENKLDLCYGKRLILHNFTVYWLALLIYKWEARVEILIERCIFKEVLGTEHPNWGQSTQIGDRARKFAIFSYNKTN